MAEELDLDLNEEEEIKNNRRQSREKDLTEKIGKAKEAEELANKAKTEAETKTQQAEKERDFFKDFATSSSRYPGATEYQDAIKEKVMAGYSVEDAVVSVLNKEGKLNTTAPPPKRENIAGGSAANQIKMDSDKPLNEMTREEKRAALVQAEAEGGDLSNILRSMQS